MAELFSCAAVILLLGWIVTPVALPMIFLAELINVEQERRGRSQGYELLERRYPRTSPI